MNEHPILFSRPMVRAILEGRKTQTRRVIQPQSDVKYCDFDDMGWELINDKRENYSAYFKLPKPSWIAPDKPTWRRMKSPYGQPGDRLWVRETFAPWPKGYLYKADYKDDGFGSEIVDLETGETHPLAWRPSIHMPRIACRLTLEIINIRAERLQDISEEDARAEGVVWQRDFGNGPETREARPVFFDVWDAINGNRDEGAYTVKKNPWVWVIEFKEVK